VSLGRAPEPPAPGLRALRNSLARRFLVVTGVSAAGTGPWLEEPGLRRAVLRGTGAAASVHSAAVRRCSPAASARAPLLDRSGYSGDRASGGKSRAHGPSV